MAKASRKPPASQVIAADPRSVAPPQAIEAEQSVLGALLLDPSCWDAVGDVLAPEHFYVGTHRAIFATIGTLIARGAVVDVITVMECGQHDPQMLNALAASVMSARNARAHATLVVERWREREVMRLAGQLFDDVRAGAQHADGAMGLVADAVTKLLQLAEMGQAASRMPRRADEVAVAFVDFVSLLHEGKVPIISTGLPDLDRAMSGGIWPGDLWVVGARPSMGKTAFTNHLARAAAAASGVLFLTMEDSVINLAARNVAALGRVNLADLRNPRKAPDSMWVGMAEGADGLSSLNLWFDDQGALSVADVRRKAQHVMRKTKLRLVVADYLQLMRGDGLNRTQQLGEIANGLKALAKELDVGIIALSQMIRETERRTGPPMMSDLRDSGDIEGAADVIALLHREAQRNPDADKNHAELFVVKNKQGPTTKVDLFFDGAVQRFGPWDGPPPTNFRGGRGGGRSGRQGME